MTETFDQTWRTDDGLHPNGMVPRTEPSSSNPDPDIAYAYDRRMVECSSCGAPLTVTSEGGRAACPDCGAINPIRPRSLDVHPTRDLDESARLAILATQGDGVGENGPLLFVAPRRLRDRDLHDMLKEDAHRPRRYAAVRRAWSVALANLEEDPLDPGAATEVLCLAAMLATYHAVSNEPLRGRAALETALDRLPDPSRRDLIRQTIAMQALAFGDPIAAARWLADCDPRPHALPVDSGLRRCRASLAVLRGDWVEVLQQLGPHDGTIPVASDLRNRATVLRAHAHFGLGRIDSGLAELHLALERHPQSAVSLQRLFHESPGPASEAGLDLIAARLQRSASPLPPTSEEGGHPPRIPIQPSPTPIAPEAAPLGNVRGPRPVRFPLVLLVVILVLLVGAVVMAGGVSLLVHRGLR
ncbi:MAG: hypothetical protein JW751_20765 [Polyangiaceae bacterium]|nr:hypothetical protein [Polyangiaceae bacterium]